MTVWEWIGVVIGALIVILTWIGIALGAESPHKIDYVRVWRFWVRW